MISPGHFGQRAATHSPWSDVQVARLRFMRWAVLRRRMTEGETDGMMVDFRRFHHVYLPGDTPRAWDTVIVRQFEAVAAESAPEARRRRRL